ncbi:dihydroorotate dehydrogenase [Elusimicrobiota bacterium]
MKINNNFAVNIAGIKFANPVLVASGTFGYGDEIQDLVQVKKLGGIITKTVTLKPKEGNPSPRIAEVASGMINTIGLQNMGVENFIKEKLPQLRRLAVPVIVSIAGEASSDYIHVVKMLSNEDGISAIELNLSCPNLKKKIICQDKRLAEEIVQQTSEISKVPIFAKLSPQVEDLVDLSILMERSGAKALSLVNTYPGMVIDVKTRKPKLSTVTGGVSGPAIKPLALKCVWDVSKSVSIPIIGGGGIMNAGDAIEFIIAGASAVSIGTANFINAKIPTDVVRGIGEYFSKNKIKSIDEIRGKLEV